MDWAKEIFSFGSNTAMGLINDALARRREKEARKENFTYNEQAADNAQTRQWETLNQFYTPQAQIQQLKEAGLSPSLMYGQGGATGQSVAPQGAGAAGIAPNYQSLLGIAQIHALEAQANLQNAQARTEEGETAMGKAEIAERLANAGAQNASKAWTETQTDYQKLMNYFTSKTMEWKIEEAQSLAETACNNAIRTGYEAEREGVRLKIDKNTKEALIQTAWNELEGSLKDLMLKDTQIQLNMDKSKQILADIINEGQRVKISQKSVDAQAKFYEDEIAKRGEEILVKQDANQVEREGQANEKEIAEMKVKTEKRGQVLRLIGTLTGAAVGVGITILTANPAAGAAAGGAIIAAPIWSSSSTQN